MQEQYIQSEIGELRDVSTQTQPRHRKVEEQQQQILSEPRKIPFDFSQIDFSQPEIQMRLVRAYRIVIEYTKRRVQTIEE